MRNKYILLVLTWLSVLTSFGQGHDSVKAVFTEFKFGGYVKADYLFSKYNNGDISATSPLRDIHLPSQIPIGPSDEHIDGDFHVKESRFNFDVNTDKLGTPIHGFLELDFLLSSQGDEKVSNSFNPRLRHFYFEWHRMLFGQTWSNFMVVVIPEDLDFAAAAEGIVFIRQPQIKYKYKTWAFSIENAETTINQNNSDVSEVTESGVLPDLTARKDFIGKRGNWSIAVIGRQLHQKDSSVSRKSIGYGLTTGGKLKVGSKGDDFRLVATYGSGLGRYVALGFVSSGVVVEEHIKNINTMNGYVAYNHYWSKVLCSSFNVSSFQGENPNEIGVGANMKAYSASINLKYKPVKELLFGVELMHAYREVEAGMSGSFERVQVSAKYIFGYQNKAVIEK